MKRLASLLALGLVLAAPALAQPGPARNRTPSPSPAPVEPCDLAGQASACSSCPGLLAALRLPGAPTGDLGLGPDQIAWSPLFVAFRLDCREAGRLLLGRGANPERGGRDGALLAEVAAQRFAVQDIRPAVSQAAALEWATLLSKPRPFDLDALIGDGMPSTRAAWAAARAAGTLPPGSAVIWSRIEALSAAFPVLVDGAERTNVDFPAPDTGLTRPSETAMSRGVEAFFGAYERGGMAEATTRVQACWSSPQAPGLPMVKRRWELERCAAMDVAASSLDAAMAPKLNGVRLPFFLDDQVADRLNALNPFVQSGLKPAAYLPALKRSVLAWMSIQYAIRSKG